MLSFQTQLFRLALFILYLSLSRRIAFHYRPGPWLNCCIKILLSFFLFISVIYFLSFFLSVFLTFFLFFLSFFFSVFSVRTLSFNSFTGQAKLLWLRFFRVFWPWPRVCVLAVRAALVVCAWPALRNMPTARRLPEANAPVGGIQHWDDSGELIV